MKSFEHWQEFQKYLRVLAKGNQKKPFDCPFLAVLPGEMFYRQSDAYRSRHFSAGFLFCSERTEPCAIKDGQSALVLGNNAKIEIPCAYNGSYLTFSLSGFEARK